VATVASTPPAARLLLGADLAATFLFALEGAIEGANARIDLFGVLVVAFATALSGGIIRDVLIGALPPATLRTVAYPVAAFSAGAIVIVAHQVVDDVPSWLVTGLDAGGLGLFAVVGAAKALDFGMNWLLAPLLGTITAVGGSTVRDVLLNHVPAVLRVDVYAVAALVGAAVLVAAVKGGVHRAAAMALGTVSCFTLRVVAAWQDWDLPRVRT
jgi:uncharacterized membrane protein YeiH